MQTEIKSVTLSPKEHYTACRRVWEMVGGDRMVQSRLTGKQVELAHNGDAWRCAQEVVEVVSAMLSKNQVPRQMSKNAILSFTSTFLLRGGLKQFGTRNGESEATPPTPVELPTKVIKEAKEKPVVNKEKPVVTKPVKAVEKFKNQAAVMKAPPAILTAVPVVKPEPEPEPEPEARQRRDPSASESYCASIVLSHLLITAAQLNSYDTDPGFEQRATKLNALLTEYQKIAEARISNWPKLPKPAHAKPV